MDETRPPTYPSKLPISGKRKHRSNKSSQFQPSTYNLKSDNLREQEALNTLKNLSPPTLISDQMIIDDDMKQNITGWDIGYDRKKPKHETRRDNNYLALTSRNFLSVLSQSLAQCHKSIQDSASTGVEAGEDDAYAVPQTSGNHSPNSKLPPRIGIFFRNQGKESSLISELKKIKDFLLSPRNKKSPVENFTSLSEFDPEKNEKSLDSAGCASTELEDNSRGGPLSPSKNQR